MDRCSPVEMRKNLEIVERFKKAGIDFVAIAVSSVAGKDELGRLGNNALDALCIEIEEAEDNDN